MNNADASVPCRHLVGRRGCRLRTLRPDGYCHIHKQTEEPVGGAVDGAVDGAPEAVHFLEFPKPKECPVCMASFTRNTRALSCGHYVHIQCVLKSNDPRCPVCRKELVEFATVAKRGLCTVVTPDGHTVELPLEMIISTVIAYRLITRNHALDLETFIAGIVTTIVSRIAPQDEEVGPLRETLQFALTSLTRSALLDPSILGA
jgi:hypothetical protein